MKPDYHIESARLQASIEDHLGIDGKVVFDFISEDGHIKLNLITINTRHNQSFLFHTEFGLNKLDALEKMLSYVKDFKDKDSSYTIQWRVTGDKELHTSYFKARDMYEALDKLHYGRDAATITIYSIVLNPMA